MENASKALLMAAGVLMGILILSLAIHLFVSFAMTSAEMHGTIENNRLSEFNSQFTSYEAKDNITIYDVITIVNLAKENNKYFDLNTQTNDNFYIRVDLKNPTENNIEKRDENFLNNLIKNETIEKKVNPERDRI